MALIEHRVRQDLVRYSHLLHSQGYVANHDGNITARVGPDRYVITPTAVSKMDMEEALLLVVDGAGQRVAGRTRPFSELSLHLRIYRERPDALAVIHAHPPALTAFGLTGTPLGVPPLPEAVVSLGDRVPTAAFATAGTIEAADALAKEIQGADVVLLPGNGAIACGHHVEMAYLRLELAEHLARILLHARPLGPVRALDPSLIQTLLAARAKAGLAPKAAQGPVPSSPPPPKAGLKADLATIVAEEVARALLKEK